MLLYEIKVSYVRQTGESNPGKVKETYLVEGFSCSDVEERLLKDIKPLVSGEFEVSDCKRVKYYDVIPNTVGDYWYKVRVDLLTEDNDGREKRKGVTILVQAEDLSHAMDFISSQLSSVDCEIVNIAKSPILDVIRAAEVAS